MVELFFNNFNRDLTGRNSSTNPINHGIILANYAGSKKIYILGVEGNGIAYLMTGKDSHFSGKDHDYSGYKSKQWGRDMNSSSRGIRIFHRLADHCKKNEIELINLSNKGILDFMHREDFNNLFG